MKAGYYGLDRQRRAVQWVVRLPGNPRRRPAVTYSSISKTRIALLEIDEIEQCFRRVRPSAMQLGRENDFDSFASRVTTLRKLVHSAEASRSEIDVMLAT